MTKEKQQNASRKIGIVFTERQIELIDDLVKSGELGGNRAEVIKQMVMFYLKENDKKSIFS